MQELQTADCILNFLESEKDPVIRDYVFDLLFADLLYHQLSSKFILQLLISYAISLKAQNTLECTSKWIIMHIGNELTQNLFNELLKDHFLLAYESDADRPQENLVNLSQICPLFTSLFITIVLDMLANNLVKQHEKILKKLFNLFEIWIEKNPTFPFMAYKSNIGHPSSYMLNPLPGLVYLTTIYPFKNLLDSLKSFTKNVERRLGNSETEIQSEPSIIEQEFSLFSKSVLSLDDLVSKVHLICLKIIKDLSNYISSQSIGSDSFKLLNLKNIESLNKRIEEFSISIDKESLIAKEIEIKSNHKLSSDHIGLAFNKILDESLERLAQLLGSCWEFGFINCSKEECRNLFKKYFSKSEQLNDISLMEVILSN